MEELRLNGSADRDRDRDRDRFGLAAAIGTQAAIRSKGVVLKAYRDPVGVLTIGAGLTKFSGVVTPKPGMTITRQEASRLLAKALERNYEPTVSDMMPGANQHEFDSGVSFHFNTGAIQRASWVKEWRSKNWVAVSAKIKLWRKAGGKVLPGLVRRRDEEFKLMMSGIYEKPVEIVQKPDFAKIVVPLSDEELNALHVDLRTLGYNVGPLKLGVSINSIKRFQADHDLTIDGIIGKATISTIQRMIDARGKSKATAVYTGGGLGGVGYGTSAETLSSHQTIGLTVGVIVVGLLAALWIAWRYRDALAVKLQRRLPKLAQKLRSF
ncbi:MAG: glycoside hydrolase family protein [Roseobacter sp.]